MAESLSWVTTSRRVIWAHFDLHTTLRRGLAHRLCLAYYPAKRRIGNSRKSTQLRESGLKRRCGLSGRLSERWQRALDHSDDVRDLASQILAGISKPDLAGIDVFFLMLHRPPRYTHQVA